MLNLIEAMSFETIAPRYRASYIESLYATCYPLEFLLANVASADVKRVERNFDFMASRDPIKNRTLGTFNTTSMLDFFPGLERWMFTELLETAGHPLIYAIARTFGEAPFDFRLGWPDITMWKDKELRFVEVEAPGDRIRASQEKIAAEFAQPLRLKFLLAAVHDEG